MCAQFWPFILDKAVGVKILAQKVFLILTHMFVVFVRSEGLPFPPKICIWLALSKLHLKYKDIGPTCKLIRKKIARRIKTNVEYLNVFGGGENEGNGKERRIGGFSFTYMVGK